MLRIGVGNGRSIVPFSGDTIDRLTQLTFAACSLDTTTKAPPWFSDAIDELLRNDESFRAWAERRQITQSPGILAGQLLEHLARDTSWMSLENDSGQVDVAELQPGRTAAEEELANREQRLWQAVQLALRLVTCQSHFSDSLESAKREAIYQLAYGLSHELNNPLANIATRARVLAEEESDPHRQQMLVAIVDQAMRGCEMIADLMLVARPPKLHFVQLDLGNLLCEIVERSRPWAHKRSVNLQLDRMTSECLIEGDADSLREAFWCLLRNSLEAVTSGGRIDIHCESKQPDDPIVVRIHDDGPGLSATALKHCLDPYYSGREAGRGLGLGLAKAERIISLHQGRICIANGAAGGCLASIEFPSTRRAKLK